MTQTNMAKDYRKAFDQFSAIYGPKTAIFLMNGKFYEFYDYLNPKTSEPYTTARSALEAMNASVKPRGEIPIWGGVPIESLHKFSQILTRDGWTVVVLDQVKDGAGGTVLRRAPARILSPGTHIEVAGQDRMSVAALWVAEETCATSVAEQGARSVYAASVADLTTGEVFSYETRVYDEILHMLQVYCVKEVVWTGASGAPALPPKLTAHEIPAARTANFAQPLAREEFFRRIFKLRGLLPVAATLGLPAEAKVLPRALALLLHFLSDHFPQATDRLISHELYTPARHMRLCNNILEQLNVITTNGNKSILSLLERTYSAMGRRALRERILRPITEETELRERWDQVDWARREAPKAAAAALRRLYDMPRLHYKLSDGSLTSVHILQLQQTYEASAQLAALVAGTPLACPPELEAAISEYLVHWNRLLDTDKARRRETEDAPTVGFLTPIAGPRCEAAEARAAECIAGWQASWKVFSEKYPIAAAGWSLQRRSDGDWVWEGPRGQLKSLAASASLGKDKGNPFTHIAFDSKKSGPITFSCLEFQTFAAELTRACWSLSAAMKEEVPVVCDDLWACVREFQMSWIAWLSTVDCSLALGSVAAEKGWCMPELAGEGGGLVLEGLAHPLLEAAASRLELVRHDVRLGDGASCPSSWLLYGVNASGKSSLMKSVGIAVLLAQAGSFVPASRAVLRPYDAAFSRIWSHDNVWAGLSSFAVEVSELQEILQLATERSLVLGDEVCSGTESASATALVAATLEHLSEIGAHSIFATHLHDLLKIPGFVERPERAIWHLRVQRTPEGKLVYDRTLQPGAGNCTYGLEVARAMGLPLALMDRAYEIRRGLEGEVTAGEAPKSRWNAQIQRQACEICGAPAAAGLEVHHMSPRATGGGNELQNLVVLCQRHHNEHHAGRLEIGPLRQTSAGPERVVVAGTAAGAAEIPAEDDSGRAEAILAALRTFSKQPLARAQKALERDGYIVSLSELKKARSSAV